MSRGESIIVTSLGTPDPDNRDDDGNALPGEPQTRTIKHVLVAPDSTSESGQSFGRSVSAGYWLALPADEVLLSTDRLEIRGVKGWQVDGDPLSGQWVSPFGKARGNVAIARRTS